MTWWSRLKHPLPWQRAQEDRESGAELESIADTAAVDVGSAHAARSAI